MKNINKAITFAKKETVLIVAMLLAVISAFFVTPDKAYITAKSISAFHSACGALLLFKYVHNK